MEEAAQLISSVGFPIAAFLLMFWYTKTEAKETREAINQNTLVLTKLTEEIHHEHSAE